MTIIEPFAVKLIRFFGSAKNILTLECLVIIVDKSTVGANLIGKGFSCSVGMRPPWQLTITDYQLLTIK